MGGGSADPSPRDAVDGRVPGPVGRVMLVTGHRTFRDALRHALGALGLDVTTDAPPGKEAVLAAVTTHPQVALVDVASDPAAGIETCRLLRQQAPRVEVVALATHLAKTRHSISEAGVTRIVSVDITVVELAGVLAYVATTAGRSGRRAGAAVARERVTLTEREREVLVLAAAGLTDGQISHTLAISHKTVKNHLHHVYGKLGARGRTDAVMLGVRRGLISP